MTGQNPTTEVVTTTPIAAELQQIIPAGMPIDKAQNILAKFSPFFFRMAEVKKDFAKIDFENITDTDILICDAGKKKTVKIRTGAEAVKDELKAEALVVNKLIDSANGVVRESCKLIEIEFEKVTRRKEIEEAAIKKELKEKRQKLVELYCENPEIYPLSEMGDGDFIVLFNGLKLGHEKKIKDAEQAQIEAASRVAAEKLHDERKNSVLSLWNFLPEEIKVPHLSEFTEQEWNEIVFNAEQKKQDHEFEQEKIRLENERLKKENEEKEAKLLEEKRIANETARIEKEKADKILAESKAKAGAERKALEEKNRIEAEKQAELLRVEKAKADKLKAEKDAADLKAEQDEAKRIADLKAAELAPDKQKLLDFSNLVIGISTNLKLDSLKSGEAKKILSDAIGLITKVSRFIDEQAFKL